MADSQSTDYTERLRQHWTEQAPAWDRWADRRAGSAEDLNRALREAAGIAPGQTVLDVGAGSGILTVGAVKLGAAKVIGIEIDDVALKAGRANLRTNGVSGVARFYAGTLPSTHVPDACADLVLANVNSVALVKLAPGLAAAVKPRGHIVAAGILAERQGSVERAFDDAGLTIRDRVYDDEWVVLICQQRQAGGRTPGLTARVR